MRKAKLLFLLCIFVLLFSSCSSTSSEVQSSSNDFATQVNEVFDTYADYGSQVFIGLSGPYTSHEKGYFEATANAYRMALLYEDLIMRVDVSIDVNTALDRDSFRTYSDALYDEARLVDVASRLEILEAKWIGGDVGAVVVATYTTPQDSHDDSDYVYADGTVFTYYYVQDSMFAAAYSAAVNLALGNAELSAVASNVETRNENLIQNSYQINLSKLKGFEIVSYSYNPETREYSCRARALK